MARCYKAEVEDVPPPGDRKTFALRSLQLATTGHGLQRCENFTDYRKLAVLVSTPAPPPEFWNTAIT